MNKHILQTYTSILKSLGQLLVVVRLYKFGHPMFEGRLRQIFTEVSKLLLEKKSLNFFESGSVFLVNGQEIEIKDKSMRRFVENFHNLHVGSLDLESGLSLEEFKVFIGFLSQEQPLQGEEKIKQYLKQKGAEHIIPRFATYKMVEKGERIVKKGGILKIDDLAPEIRSKFLQDLRNEKISKQLVEGEESYQLLAHDPVFLSKTVFNLVGDKESPKEIARILWLIGDYLIEEISTSRKEELNRKILDELKNRLLPLWEQKINKPYLKEEIQETFIAISTALQLKGLILLYQRHKKDLEKVAREIRKILETLPPQSRLYQKTKERLEKIDAAFPFQK